MRRLLEALSCFGPLARDVTELKRIRDQSTTDTVAERLFRRAWNDVITRDRQAPLWSTIVADAVIATRLAGIDLPLLQSLGLNTQQCTDILLKGFDEAAAALPLHVAAGLRDTVGTIDDGAPLRQAPSFVSALIRQPRAGATSPGKPRLMLEPAESHGDHCLLVAVLGALIALVAGGDPARVFVAGLAHHLHNAVLPDAGFAGEMLLGDNLQPIVRQLFLRELQVLPPAPRARVEDALLLIADADTAEGRAFHAADVIDRVLQAHHYTRAAAFTADQALDDLQLVHEGPLRPFQAEVLAAVGLA